jgi:hypothetical protein
MYIAICDKAQEKKRAAHDGIGRYARSRDYQFANESKPVIDLVGERSEIAGRLVTSGDQADEASRHCDGAETAMS